MEQNVQNDLENKLVQVQESFDSLNISMESRFTSLTEGINQSFTTSSKQVMEAFATLKNTLDIQDEGLRNYLEGKVNGLEVRMDSVFQSVSSGKGNLASALLTKGVTIREDATFMEIMNAILSIKQQLLIGVEQIPGEIQYDYHYHVDGSGQQPHTDTLLTNGGCYSVPIYHVHVSPCYSSRACGGRAEKKTYMVQGCNCGSQLGGGTRCGKHGCWFEAPSAQYPSGCARCNCPKTTDWICTVCGAKAGGDTCSSIKTVLICPKNGNTIDKYRVGCKLNDGQIIAAHIVYQIGAIKGMKAFASTVAEYIPPFETAEYPVLVPEYEEIVEEETADEEVVEEDTSTDSEEENQETEEADTKEDNAEETGQPEDSNESGISNEEVVENTEIPKNEQDDNREE